MNTTKMSVCSASHRTTPHHTQPQTKPYDCTTLVQNNKQFRKVIQKKKTVTKYADNNYKETRRAKEQRQWQRQRQQHFLSLYIYLYLN